MKKTNYEWQSGESERGLVGGRREELEYLNNLAPCGWDDRSVILKEGPAAREMRGCNETLACLCVCCSSLAAHLIWQVFSRVAIRLVIQRAGVT